MTNYEKGKRFEQKIAKEARESGLIAIRSAASKSPYDIIILNNEKRLIQFIQCKTGNISDKKLTKIEKDFKPLKGYYLVDFKVLHKK